MISYLLVNFDHREIEIGVWGFFSEGEYFSGILPAAGPGCSPGQLLLKWRKVFFRWHREKAGELVALHFGLFS
jgi:hypothetical protein